MLITEVGVNFLFGFAGSFLAGNGLYREGYVCQYIKDVAVFGVDNLLHFSYGFFIETFFRQGHVKMICEYPEHSR